MRKEFETEAAMAALVIPWLRDQGWEVYQEVAMGSSSTVCDIVARRDPLLWAIECKLSYGTAVVSQAWRWIPYANLVSVATPLSKGNDVLDEFCGWKGIGQIQISRNRGIGEKGPDLRLRRKRSDRLLKALRPEQITWCPAGAAHGGHYTPFKATCREVVWYVQQHPGTTLKDLIDNVETHYCSKATARSSISRLAKMGIVPGVRVVQEGGSIKLFPSEEEGGRVLE